MVERDINSIYWIITKLLTKEEQKELIYRLEHTQ